MWTIFLAIGALGILLLVLGVVFDGVFDFFDFGGDGLLSLTSIGGAVTGLGAGGALAISAWDSDLPTAVITGVIVALGMGFVAYKISQAVKGLESESPAVESKVGITGYAIGDAESGDSFEFMVHHAGMRKKMLAIADHPVKSGDNLVIETVMGSTRVKVKNPDDTQAIEPSDDDIIGQIDEGK